MVINGCIKKIMIKYKNNIFCFDNKRVGLLQQLPTVIHIVI